MPADDTSDVAALFARLKEELHAAGPRGSDVPPAQVRLSIRDSFTGPTGLTPAQVADRVLDAIRARRFWIITHAGERPVFEARVDGILADFPTVQ